MTKYKKIIKIISTIELILGILALIGALCFFTIGVPITVAATNDEVRAEVTAEISQDAKTMENLEYINKALNVDITPENSVDAILILGLSSIAIGFSFIIAGVWEIFIFVFGRKATKKDKPKGAFIIGLITTVLDVISIICNLVSGITAGITLSIIAAILIGVYTYCAYKLKKENNPVSLEN